MSLLDDILDGMDKWSELKTTEKRKQPEASRAKLEPSKKKRTFVKRDIPVLTEADLSLSLSRSRGSSPRKEDLPADIDDVVLGQVVAVSKEIFQLVDAPVITKASESRIAAREILDHKMIAVDCEGVNLGRSGKLTLIQVATAEKSYLFDSLVGGKEIFDHGLRQVLEDKNVMKVMHDCRLDSDALFHEFNVKLNNVFDTQVAFAMVCRGKGQSTPLPVSLNTLLKKHGMGSTNEFKDVMKTEMQNNPEFWAIRPMTDAMLGYARQDVIFLCKVQEQLSSLLTVSSRKLVAKYSDGYAKQYRDNPDFVHKKRDPESTERFVPQYGIKEWDMDTSLNLQRSAGRNRR